MVFQPTSPVRRYSSAQRAAQIQRKRTASATESDQAPTTIASAPPKSIPEEINEQIAPAPPSKDRSSTAKPAQAGFSRSGSLSDRLRSSWKGGVSSLLKKSQDNVRAEARAKSTASKHAAPSSRPGSAAAGSVKGKPPVELPAKERERVRPTHTTKTTNSSVVDPSYDAEGERFTATGTKSGVAAQPQEPTSFFDDSSSDEKDDSPVIQRASSVRVGKPTVVRHASNAAAHSIRKDGEPAESGLSRDTASETASEAATSEVDKRDSVATEEQGPEDALRRLEGDSTSFAKPLPSPPTTTTQISPTQPLVASPAPRTPSTVHTCPQQPSTAVPTSISQVHLSQYPFLPSLRYTPILCSQPRLASPVLSRRASLANVTSTSCNV